MSVKQATSMVRRLRASTMIGKDLYRHGFALFLMSGIINVLALTGSVYMMQVYDRALTSGSVETLGFLSALAIGLYLFYGIFDILRTQILVCLGARLDRRMAPVAHKLAIDMPRRGFSTVESLERSREIDTLRGFLSSQAPAAILDLPWMPVFLIFVYFLHPILGSVTLAGAVVLALITILAELRSRRLTSAAQQAMIMRNNLAESNARNSDAITAMGITERAVDRFIHANEEHLSLQGRSANITGSLASMSRVLRMLLQSALLGLGAWLTIKGEMSAGAIIAVSVASARALAPIDQVIGNWRNILSARHAYCQLRDMMAAADEDREYMEFPRAHETLTVENLTIASPATGRVLLAEANFELKAGQAMAIVGPSGGGKSTLIRALAGVWSPLRGSIRLDGVNLRHLSADQQGELVGYLPQEVNLFNGSIIDNINRFSPTRDSEHVYSAAVTAGVHKMIVEMPDGYDTQIGSMGTALSAGQRQRIGLARALYRDPFIVLLDEPNASLDAVGEKALNETIRMIRERGGIVVVVAHRPNVLAAVDMVGVVHAGKLVAFGPKGEVLKNKKGKVTPPVDFGGSVPAQHGFDHQGVA